jgi:SsrA-binding protein
MVKEQNMKLIVKNKESLFNFEILDTWQAGLVLTGPEVKAVKAGQLSLKGSFIQLDSHNEAWLTNTYIAPYKPAKTHQTGYDPYQRRKLLLTKREIDSIIGKKAQKGLTIVPISVYTKRRLIKIEIGLARGKSKVDKRESIKKKEVQREIRRTLKQ